MPSCWRIGVSPVKEYLALICSGWDGCAMVMLVLRPHRGSSSQKPLQRQSQPCVSAGALGAFALPPTCGLLAAVSSAWSWLLESCCGQSIILLFVREVYSHMKCFDLVLWGLCREGQALQLWVKCNASSYLGTQTSSRGFLVLGFKGVKGKLLFLQINC